MILQSTENELSPVSKIFKIKKQLNLTNLSDSDYKKKIETTSRKINIKNDHPFQSQKKLYNYSNILEINKNLNDLNMVGSNYNTDNKLNFKIFKSEEKNNSTKKLIVPIPRRRYFPKNVRIQRVKQARRHFNSFNHKNKMLDLDFKLSSNNIRDIKINKKINKKKSLCLSKIAFKPLENVIKYLFKRKINLFREKILI